MRAELFTDPLLLLHRIGEWALTRRRLRYLNGTVARRLEHGHIDTLELLELVRPLNPGMIFDIGAHSGTWTLLAKALYPHAQIHAFEPFASHADKFEIFLKGAEKVALHRIALGGEERNAILHITDFSDASSILELADEGRRQWSLSEVSAAPVKLHKLDDFIAHNGLRRPDLIKIDVQGFEVEVFRGAPTTLRHVQAVIAECSFKQFYKAQCHFDNVVGHLATHGLFVHAFGARTAVGKPLVQADVLFTRRDC